MTAASQRAARCIGEPISWLRLEQWALAADAGGARPAERAAVAAHLDACDVCRACADELRADLVVLPALAVPSRAAPRRRWAWRVPAFALAGAAVLALVLWRRPGGVGDDAIAHVKGVGSVQLGVVRERAGAIRDDAITFAAGDRWKVVITCPPGAAAWIDVAVNEPGAPPDYPLAPALLTCGNQVVVPGAFTVTGAHPNRVCVRIGAGELPMRTAPQPGDANVACLTLRPE